MDVRIFPNSRRPGIGVRPHREAQRPLLPQHARHCPVLEAGSSLGYLVHPPLADRESYIVEYLGEGRYRFVYSIKATDTEWKPLFVVAFQLSVGGTGARREDVTLMIEASEQARDLALTMTRMFIVPDDMGTPAGAVTLRGAWNFRTPAGWDTVYSPVFNNIERPVAPMMSIRVETDWYVHETEFRYVLQPGESITGAHNLPIGQVFFVPREEFLLKDCSEAEIAELQRARDAFARGKAGDKLKTPYGLEYSPFYLKVSRAQAAAQPGSGAERGGDGTAAPGGAGPVPPTDGQ
ncbi:MAG: hypothetical protein ABL971_16615 [Vicinamibacterales bacterium]